MSQPLSNKTSRFARLVHQPGGISMDEAVSASHANLETIRDRVVTEIDSTMERIDAVVLALRRGPTESALQTLYTLSNSLTGMAGVFAMDTLGQASFSMCELIDRMKELRRWDGAAIEIHAEAMRHIRRDPKPNGDSHAAIIAALKQVVNRIS